jgi:hypothetical protein
MKISKSMFAYIGLAGCLCLVGFVTPVAGQQAPARGHGILGTLDPQTGAFKPLIKPDVVEDLETAATAITPTTGTFVVNLTITVKSTDIPSTDVIACTVDASVTEINLMTASLTFFAEESASVAATSRTATGGKCTVTIPYSWRLATPKTDTVTLQYTITAPVETANQLPNRMSTQSISTGLVPTSGATTTINLNATI